MPSWLRYLFIAALALAGISLFGLAATSSDSKLFEKWFPVLSIVNRAIAVLLFAVVVAMVVRLWQRIRAREFGAYMTSKLAGVIALIVLIPCLTIYVVSNVFISRSIDSWFDVRVERALDSGVTITRGILTEQQKQAELAARHMAEMLVNTPTSLIMTDLMHLLEGHQNMEALVFTGSGTAVAAAGSRINVMLPDLPTPLQLQTVRSAGIYSVIDGDALENPDGITEASQLSIRVIVPISDNDETIAADANEQSASEPKRNVLLPTTGRQPQFYLQIIQPVSSETTKNAAELVAGYRDYQTLVLSRASLQTIYTSTLFLVLLLAAFGAIAAALAFARKTTEPVMQLEQGTRRVADGNFQPIREFSGNSEINVLTQSFNTMIREVAESRRGIEAQRLKAEQAQAYLERVLSNISSGVLVLDANYRTVSSNPAAKKILGSDLCQTGSNLRAKAPDLALAASNAKITLSLGETPTVGLEYELNTSKNEQSPEEALRTPLFIKISLMPLRSGANGLVLVFDDVSQLMAAQRATAWGEVARRLAHEIKNPLTPIRLAAERLEMRLENKLSEESDINLLHRTIATITTQVDALKQMVNDFREYAKIPTAKLSRLSLNAFLEEVAQLYHEADVPVRLELDNTIPLIEADPAQLRQVLHNLISNSVDATEGDRPQIVIETKHIGTGTAADGSAVLLRISDNGVGFSSAILDKAFEPYITTKETGTGLGLPMVKKILDEHNASIRLSNKTDPTGCLVMGAQVDIIFKRLGH
mgnify:FL=1